MKNLKIIKMNTSELVEWQRVAPNGLVYPWFTHPFLDQLETWNLSNINWLEFGAGRSTAWLRSKCKYVVSIEANSEWAQQAERDCQEAGLANGVIHHQNLREGVNEDMPAYFEMIPKDVQFDVISVDGIFRNESLEWAIDHFKGRQGILIADNFGQDYVWISPAAEEIMKPYHRYAFYQPDHTNHEGRSWNTSYWIIK